MFDCRVNGKAIPKELLGPFRENCAEDSTPGFRERLKRDGYLFVRGLIDVTDITAARQEVFQRLAEVGEIAEPVEEGIFTGISSRKDLHSDPGVFWKSVSEGKNLRGVTHGAAIQKLMDSVFGEEARGYDYIFLRPGVVGRFTFPHYDRPFFARGTKNVLTAWTAIGDIPTTEGSLFVLENSHRFDDLTEATEQIDYGSADSPQVQMMDDAIEFARSRGSRFLTASFEPGDVIIFGMTTMHGAFDNYSQIGRTRLSVDVRWQPASEPIDGRYFGENPAGTTGIGYGELNGAKPLTEPWHTR